MFLHIVSCDAEYCITPEDCTINGVPVLFFKTYVGAARKVRERRASLISCVLM
jgi:hypothetical protein